MTESDFKKYFDQFGTITDVVVMYDHNTQRPRGFGFITYDSADAVDKVLYRKFHELNGKMVEVKQAVPKESSSGPNRGQLGGYSYGVGRVSSFLNGFSQGYNSGSAGGYGRFSPVTVGRSGYSSFNPGYGTGLNFEPGLNPSYGVNANLSSNLNYGQGLSPSYGVNSIKYSSASGYGVSGGNSSILSLPSRNLWGNGNLNYATNSTNSSSFVGSGSGNAGMGSLGSIGALWGSSFSSGQGGSAGSSLSSGSLTYGSGDVNFGSTGLGYGRNSGTSVTPASAYTTNGGFARADADIFNGGSFYGDSTWRSSPSELEGSVSFGYGMGNAASDVLGKNSAGHVGDYSVANRQSTRGTQFLLRVVYINPCTYIHMFFSSITNIPKLRGRKQTNLSLTTAMIQMTLWH